MYCLVGEFRPEVDGRNTELKIFHVYNIFPILLAYTLYKYSTIHIKLIPTLEAKLVISEEMPFLTCTLKDCTSKELQNVVRPRNEYAQMRKLRKSRR